MYVQMGAQSRCQNFYRSICIRNTENKTLNNHNPRPTGSQSDPAPTSKRPFRKTEDLGGLGVDTGDVSDQVADSSRVSHLVVVPSDELDELVVEGDTGLGVEDGRSGGSDKVGRAVGARRELISLVSQTWAADFWICKLTRPRPRCTRGFP